MIVICSTPTLLASLLCYDHSLLTAISHDDRDSLWLHITPSPLSLLLDDCRYYLTTFRLRSLFPLLLISFLFLFVLISLLRLSCTCVSFGSVFSQYHWLATFWFSLLKPSPECDLLR